MGTKKNGKTAAPRPDRKCHGVNRAALLLAWGEMHAAARAFELHLGIVLSTARRGPGHPDEGWLDTPQIEEAERAAAELSSLLGSPPIDADHGLRDVLTPLVTVPGGGAVSTKKNAAKRKRVTAPREVRLDPAAQAETERRLLAEYHRKYLRAWYCDAMHIIGHLRWEADQMQEIAEKEPDGAFAAMGAGCLAQYADALGSAHAALGSLMPPTATTPIVLRNVVDKLDQLRRRAPWKDGEG